MFYQHLPSMLVLQPFFLYFIGCARRLAFCEHCFFSFWIAPELFVS